MKPEFIRCSRKTQDKLKKLKLEKESYEKVILRLIKELKK